MRAKKSTAIFLILLLLFTAGCGSDTSITVKATLLVTGDVEKELHLTEYGDYAAIEVNSNGKTLSCIKMTDLLKSASVTGSDISVAFHAPDGVMAEIPYDQMKNCYLTLSVDRGWQCIATKHPPQAGIRNIDKIVVCASKPEGMDRCLRIMDGDALLKTYTYGQLFMSEANDYAVLEGSAEKNGYTVKAYTKRSLLPLKAYIRNDATEAVAYYGDGSQGKISLNGYIEWRGNSADYLDENFKNRKKDIVGVWINAPENSLTDVSAMVRNALIRYNVMIIELDGMGYQNSLKLKEQLNFKDNATLSWDMGRTVMPSVSNVSLASIITGKTPDKTGITSRDKHDLKIEDMFKEAKNKGKSTAVIEGDKELISMGVPQTLNVDSNGNGSTDEEVFASAQKALADGTQLTYIHFHGFDDTSHTYGPSSVQAMTKMSELAGYLNALVGSFSGKVIIIADHGQHDVNADGQLGNHGTFIPEDMIVPFATLSCD